MTKLDLKKTLRHLYNPSQNTVTEVDVPPMNFIMIDGQGDPNTAQSYKEAVEALFGLAYSIKFAGKKERGTDFAVMPLEGLWWMADMGAHYGDFDFTAHKDRWLWTMMIVQPDPITPQFVQSCLEAARKKRALPAFDRVRFEAYHEGPSAQIMHIGPYSAEKPNIDRIHAYIAEKGGDPAGKHHEIYLSDPRRTAQEKLKTVIRQPMRKR